VEGCGEGNDEIFSHLRREIEGSETQGGGSLQPT